MTRRFRMAAVLAALAIGGCANDIAPTPPGAPPPTPYVYRIGADDHLKITVYGEPNLTGEYVVNNQGQLSFPIVGLVDVSGLTVAELVQRLTSGLQTTYKAPNVSVDLVTFRPFFVLGEVNKAGQFPYASGMTVLGAVATAGGFTYRANTKAVMIRHPGSNAEEKAPLTADLMVQPGDTVRILERYF